MKFCPQCGQRLAGSSFEEKKTYVPTSQAPSKGRNWFERHPGWTLLLVIVCAPFIVWGITAALIALATLLPSGIDEAAAIGAITAMPLAYIAVVVTMVRWYRQKRKQSKTIADYAKTSGLHIDNTDAYYKRGDAAAEAGEYGQAIADYSKAIELDPGYSLAYFNRAYAYGEIGDYDKAIADYSKTIELDPNDLQAYYNRGLDYQNKGEVPKAVSDLEKCIELSTDPEITKDAQQALYEMKFSEKRVK